MYLFLGEYNVDPDGSYSGGKPFLVHCSFPNNLTIIGDEVEIEIEKCIAEQCHETQINYTMPVEQMKKIFTISGRCTQTIDFHCKTAPLQVIFFAMETVDHPQLPGRLFGPSDICKKLSQNFLLHFSIGMGSYDHHTTYQGVFP